MKNVKRYALIAAAVLAVGVLCFFLFRPAGKVAGTGENLLINGDFSDVKDGLPVGWYRDAWAGLTGSDFEVVDTEEGKAAHIVNHLLKDARFAQTVDVEPDTLYLLHGYIKADAQDGWGANLSVEDVYLYSDNLYDTAGEWEHFSLYGRTGRDQHSVTVYVRLGGYSGEAIGEAYYRDIVLEKVGGVPEGYSAQNWFRETGIPLLSNNAGQGDAGFLLVLCGAAYVLCFAILCRFLRKPQSALNTKSIGEKPWCAVIILLAACALRLVIAEHVSGYDVDIGCFRAWANRMAATGPVNFYDPSDPFASCDYPPGYMLILWLVGLIGKAGATGATEFMVKVPPVLADIVLCAVLYREAKKQKLSGPAALALVTLYALNPLIIVAGSAWGQADALMTLFLALTVLYAVRGKWIAALPFYIVSVLFKPQALMFGPLGLLALGMHIVYHWKNETARQAVLRDVGLGLAAMAAAALLIVVPFSIHLPADWLFTLYGQTMGRYAYATVNSCNLYFLLGKNWVTVESSLSGAFLLPFLTWCLAVLPLLTAAVRRAPIFRGQLGEKKDRIRLYTLSGLAAALGLTMIVLSAVGSLDYSTLGTVMIVYAVAVFAALYAFANDIKHLPVFGAGLLLLLFNTGSMMHERYLFPAVALLLLGYLWNKDVRILWLAVGVTVAGFLNVGCALDRNTRIGGASGHLDAPAVGLQSDMAVLEYAAAALNCLVCFASLALCSALSRGECVSLLTERQAASPLPQETPTRKMTRRDWVILACVTAAYAVLTFTNLGSMKAPQTAYVSESPDEQITFDLGKNRQFNMLYFGGIHYYSSDFPVEISEDGENWTQYYTAGMAEGDCFKWKYLSYAPGASQPVTLMGRYVRLTANHYSLTLFEVLFKDLDSGEICPAAIIANSGDNETASNMLDEQDTLEGEPGWYNSTYFDEIYHARTGYEHLHHLQTYETTHPPLGKVFISWAIAIFGMTPFGWRFAGALAGVLMLPGMYLLGKLFAKRWWGGMAAALLMAFDLMHFTQTRIATIDSFAVLFIIWMMYFMFVWYFQDFFGKPFWKTLVPLGLSGLFMGLGVASKWTACYAGVILAIIFFAGIWRRTRLIAAAKKTNAAKRTEGQKHAASNGAKQLMITIASCLIFFVLIPAVIYYLSYIPYFAYDGVGVTPKKVIEAAVGTYFTNGQVGGMLGYHSEPGRGMDHDFYSPWYQWPVIGKPMWYAANSFEPEGYESSIMALGNPAVWWSGLICIVICLAVWIRRHMRRDTTLTPFTETDDTRPALILLCYFGQLMPWILVPRGTYIYHYFPCVPFLILAMVLCLDLLADAGVKAVANSGASEQSQKQQNIERGVLILVIILLVAAAAMFVLFFPYASGIPAKRSWMEAVKWFDRWLWY